MNFQKLIGYCFLSLDKEGWRVAPGWFEPGDYLINVSYFFKNNKLFFYATTGNIRSVVVFKFRDGFLS